MTNQNQPPEVRIAQLEQYAKAVESVNREIKAINAGLTDRCGQLAAERDGQAADANQLRQIVQSHAQDIAAKVEQIKSLIVERDNNASAAKASDPQPVTDAA